MSRRALAVPVLALWASLAACGGDVAPAIWAQPEDATVTVGDPVDFTVEVSGEPAPTVRWQRSADGATWTDVPDATGLTLSIAATVLEDDGASFRAVAENPSGTAASEAALLRVAPVPVQPVILAPTHVTRGTSRLVAVEASLDGHTYAWTTTGGTFAGGASTAARPVVRIYPDALSSAMALTCVASNAAGREAAPATATVILVEAPVVVSFSAEEEEVAAGAVVHLNATFTGGPGVLAYGDVLAAVSSQVRFTSEPILEDTSFTLTVTNLAGDAAAAGVTVRVAP